MGVLVGFTGPRDPRLLARMAEAVVHRGTGPAVVHEGSAGSVAVRRACGGSSLDSSGLAVDGDAAVAIAGSVTSCGDRPGPVRPRAVLDECVASGVEILTRLRGAFVAAVLHGDRLVLARDGVGVRSAYYGRHEGRLLFGIEPKAVLAAPGFPRRICPASVAQYLTFSFVPGERTMLEDLHELPAGHLLEVRGTAAPTLRRWFFFERPDREEGADDSVWVERFREAHRAAVAARLPAGERVGSFLSGGIDSSVVTVEAAAQHAPGVNTYSIHFGEDQPNELEFARAVAQRSGTAHVEVLVRPKDFLPRLRRIVWHLDEPIGDPITVPNFELAARAARDVRWVLNGEGGDPVFGGPKNIPMMLQHWYGGIERGPGFRERAYLASYRRCFDEWADLVAPDIVEEVDPAGDLEGLLTPFFETDEPPSFLNKLCAINIRLKGAHLILPKVDRMLGAHGIVAASPLFDERLVRMSFQMPPGLKLRDGIEKVVLKEAYRGDLPAPVVRRPKSGMRVPVRFWLRGELRRYARKVLAPKEVRRVGLFDERRVRRLFDFDTDQGSGRHGLKLWMLLTFEIWRRIVVENEPP